MPALSGLGEDLGEGGVPVASVDAVEGGLLPARLRFGPGRLKRRVGLEVFILLHRNGILAGLANAVPERVGTYQHPPTPSRFNSYPGQKKFLLQRNLLVRGEG